MKAPDPNYVSTSMSERFGRRVGTPGQREVDDSLDLLIGSLRRLSARQSNDYRDACEMVRDVAESVWTTTLQLAISHGYKPTSEEKARFERLIR